MKTNIRIAILALAASAVGCGSTEGTPLPEGPPPTSVPATITLAATGSTGGFVPGTYNATATIVYNNPNLTYVIVETDAGQAQYFRLAYSIAGAVTPPKTLTASGVYTANYVAQPMPQWVNPISGRTASWGTMAGVSGTTSIVINAMDNPVVTGNGAWTYYDGTGTVNVTLRDSVNTGAAGSGTADNPGRVTVSVAFPGAT